MSSKTAPQEIRQDKRSDELELPETLYVRDIENRVIQAFVLQALSKIDGVGLMEGNFIDSILGRDSVEGVRGIHVEQDSKNHSVSVRVEVVIRYGVAIPEKAEEIQATISEDITSLTGLHVSCVHVVFKNVALSEPEPTEKTARLLTDETATDQYSDEF